MQLTDDKSNENVINSSSDVMHDFREHLLDINTNVKTISMNSNASSMSPATTSSNNNYNDNNDNINNDHIRIEHMNIVNEKSHVSNVSDTNTNNSNNNSNNEDVTPTPQILHIRHDQHHTQNSPINENSPPTNVASFNLNGNKNDGTPLSGLLLKPNSSQFEHIEVQTDHTNGENENEIESRHDGVDTAVGNYNPPVSIFKFNSHLTVMESKQRVCL